MVSILAAVHFAWRWKWQGQSFDEVDCAAWLPRLSTVRAVTIDWRQGFAMAVLMPAINGSENGFMM
jgi:hypothetical protein